MNVDAENTWTFCQEFFSRNLASIPEECPCYFRVNMHPPDAITTMEDHEFILLLLLLQFVAAQQENAIGDLESLLASHIREQRRLNRSLPADKVRVTWSAFVDRITTVHFRRMFRMPIEAFNDLCQKLTAEIGEEEFRSEKYLAEASNGEPSTFISGEVKVGVCIRMLAGGSYLDLVPLFDVCKSYLYTVFGQFLDWVLQTFRFPLVKWIRNGNWEVLNHLANQFAEKSNGVFFGPFGSIDGLAIRIRSPRLSEVPDPGNYYCRKGFYALNVQAICDKKKRFLWCYPSNKGSTHDSAAFGGSRLYELLKETTVSNKLLDYGLFIAGDSAYSLAPFLIVPYDADETEDDIDGAMDSFNFHLSSCRIYIECAFGELVMRWGIFWRTLLFDLQKSTKIINVCMLLHNHIIDRREGDDTEDARFFREFRIEMDRTQQEISRQAGEVPRAVVADNNEPRRCGRPSIDEAEQRALGAAIRNRLTVKLAANDMRRPLQHDMRYNQHGNIHMTS